MSVLTQTLEVGCNMKALISKYTINPVIKFYNATIEGLERSGMAKAAVELEKLGYHKESQEVLKNLRKRSL